MDDGTRRQVMAGGAAAAGLGLMGADAASPPDLAMKGLKTRSESVHSGVASADGKLRLTTRLCRYPELGRAWVWVHALTPWGFYEYVDHWAECGREPVDMETGYALYVPTRVEQSFERTGKRASPDACVARGRVKARKSHAAVQGEGDTPFDFETRFAPAAHFEGLLEGRTEIFGRAHCTLKVGGREVAFDGPAQWHEQVQTDPRFVDPFCYATLWSGDGGCTLLIAGDKRAGYIATPSGAAKAVHVDIDPPSASHRRVRIRLDDGRAIEATAQTFAQYAVTCQGDPWRGHMVAIDLDGRRYVGHINDFRSHDVRYHD